MLLETLHARLHAIETQECTRNRRVAEGPTAPRQRVYAAGHPDGSDLLCFCSNDYLGLASHPRLVDALAEGARRFGAGAGASHLVSGHSMAHEALELRLARWYAPHIPDARVLGFCSGYMANLALVAALGDADAENTEIFSETLNHASLIDGARLSRAGVTRYPHCDVVALGRQLAASRARIKLIVTDAVFSMDGCLAPLPQLLTLAETHDAWLIVDDAHGFGVLGAAGRGSLEHFQLRSERLILMGTLGKAAGLSGAFVAAHSRIIDYLLQAARSYIFTTAASPALAHALQTSLDLIEGHEGRIRRTRLRILVSRLRAGLAPVLNRHPALGWRLLYSPTAVQALVVGDNTMAMALAGRLEAEGLRVPGIRPPTVPEGQARLRITLCAAHTLEDVDQLLVALDGAARAFAQEAVTA